MLISLSILNDELIFRAFIAKPKDKLFKSVKFDLLLYDEDTTLSLRDNEMERL